MVAAALWLSNLATTTKTVSAAADKSAAQGTAEAREAFQRGKDLYRRGNYAQALPLLQQAQALGKGLPAEERSVTSLYLSRTRDAVKGGGAARGQSERDLPQGVDAAAKTRVERLMAQAMTAARQGDQAEAARLATQALHLSREARLTFTPTEMSPADFLSHMETASSEVKTLAWAGDEAPVNNAIESNPSRGRVQLTSHEAEWSEPAAEFKPAGTPKEQALQLVAAARADLKAGRYEAAQKKAIEAKRLGVSYDLFDDRPELVLNDVERHTGSYAVAGKTADSKVTIAPKASVLDARHADELVAAARNDLKAGNLDAAKEKAAQAKALNSSYHLFEDRPELVLNEVAAAKSEAPAAERTAAPAGKADVKRLMAEARQALQAGRFDEAKQRAKEAEKLANASQVAFDLFEDNPEMILADAERFAARGGAAAPVAEARPAAAPDAQLAERAKAERLMKEARQLMQAGKLEQARAKVAEAERMDVAYDVFADTPEMVMADLNKVDVQNIAGRGNTGGVKPAAAEANPFAEEAAAKVDLASGTGRPAPAAAESAVVRPEGLSAVDHYNRGMFELNRGNRKAAHESFLAAHQSGQKLDGYRAQRLANYLRELAPKGGQGIQMVNHQVADGAPAETNGEPRVIDEAAREQGVKFDRLRTDSLNAIFKAESLRAKNPEEALIVIDRALASVEGSELPPESIAALSSSLNKTRTGIENEIKRQQPNLDQKRKNEEVLAEIKTGLENKVRIEQEFAKLVEEFNTLNEQKRFAEAEIVAKKAKELDPNNPTAEVLFWKARFNRRIARNEKLKLDKEESFIEQLNDVEQSTIVEVGDAHPVKFPDNWKDLSDRRKQFGGPDNRKRSDSELKIEESLTRAISLHEDNVPLGEVIKKIATFADINIVVDPRGLDEEQTSTNELVTIDLDGVKVKSALKLILDQFNLGYVIQDDVLKITSRIRQQGEMQVRTYPVADLVVPIPNFVPSGSTGMTGNGGNGVSGIGSGFGGAQMSVPSGFPGQAMAQVGPNVAGGMNPLAGDGRLPETASTVDFDTLTDLITRTINPESWDSNGGQGSVKQYETTLSLVIRQTQGVHEEIADLLAQLRRLQDLQVTIEVRFVTVADRFFERIGIDFDFNIQDTVGGPVTDNSGLPLPPFGAVQLPQAGIGGTTTGTAQQGQQQGQQTTTGTTQAGNFIQTPPRRNVINRDDYQSGGTIVGLSAPDTFSPDLDVPFRQGSFEVGVPDFGGFNPNAGVQVGLAILSDIEAFFFIQAAQGDKRTNLLFAPKVTLFNGQTASVQSTTQRPFVTSLIPTVGFFSVGFQPQITVLSEGVTLSVQAVISADRRFVRLTVVPSFTNITDVFTFSFVGGAGNQQQQGQQQQGVQGNGNNAFGGNTQNGNGQFGFGGIGGAVAGNTGNNQNGNNNNQGGNTANQTITIQQPVFEVVNVLTTVSVPDGGTVLLGGVKRLREGRNMSGVPILNKIPYVSRLFKNSGVGRETESLMMMVTPRIIIQEEEEELLGIPTGT